MISGSPQAGERAGSGPARPRLLPYLILSLCIHLHANKTRMLHRHMRLGTQYLSKYASSIMISSRHERMTTSRRSCQQSEIPYNHMQPLIVDIVYPSHGRASFPSGWLAYTCRVRESVAVARFKEMHMRLLCMLRLSGYQRSCNGRPTDVARCCLAPAWYIHARHLHTVTPSRAIASITLPLVKPEINLVPVNQLRYTLWRSLLL